MDFDRYSRQILFSGIGSSGQQRLAQSRIVLVGCGALGAMQAEMLARAGAGFLRLIDRDFIETSNLHRQVMFDERDAAARLPKAVAAAARIGQINAAVSVEAVVRDVNYTNIEALIADADLVLDGADNFEVRFLLNDAAVKLGKPWIYGAAVGAHGAQMTIRPGLTPCLRCVFPEMPAPGTAPTCDTAGVILPIIAVIAAHQIAEAIKLLTGQPEKLHASLLQFNLWENTTNRLQLRAPDHTCPTCALRQFEFLQARGGQMITALCGRNAVQVTPAVGHQLDLARLAERLQASGEVSYNRHLLRFQTGAHELNVFADARAIIKGTDDPHLARSLYARYIGA